MRFRARAHLDAPQHEQAEEELAHAPHQGAPLVPLAVLELAQVEVHAQRKRLAFRLKSCEMQLSRRLPHREGLRDAQHAGDGRGIRHLLPDLMRLAHAGRSG